MSEAPELTLSQINGRFKILDGPVALPGRCVVCGGVKGKFVDFGLDVEFYGAVIFCVPCIVAAAEVVDLVPGSKYRELELKYQNVIEDVDQVESVINEHIVRFDLLHDAFITRLRSFGTADATSNETVIPESEQTAVGDSEQVSDPVVNEGSFSVPSSNGDGDGSIFDF